MHPINRKITKTDTFELRQALRSEKGEGKFIESATTPQKIKYSSFLIDLICIYEEVQLPTKYLNSFLEYF